MNSKDIIAEIRLSNGEVGWYDEYTRIYLTILNPTAYVYAGMNLTQIKRSLASGRIRLVRGSLVKPEPVKPEAPKEEPVVEKTPVVEKEPTVEEMPIVEDIPASKPEKIESQETPVVEETSVPEEIVAEEAPVKSARKSRTKK